MQRAYGGWQVAEQHGWNWSRWFSDWDAALATTGEQWVETKKAFDPVRQFELFQLDNHTTVPLGLRFGAGSSSVVLKEEPPAECTALRNKSGLVFPLNPKDPSQRVKSVERFDGSAISASRYLSFPSNRGIVEAVKCGDAWIETTPVRGLAAKNRQASLQEFSGEGGDRPALRRLSEDLAYLRLPSFYKQNSEIIEQERSGWPRPSGREKALLVDLRGNEGGDAAFEALEGWVSEKELRPLIAFNKRLGASCLYHALRWGYGGYSSGDLKPPLTPNMRNGLQSGLNALSVQDNPDCPARFEDVRATRHYKDRTGGTKARPRKPRLFVLVDNECGSDCELMAYTLAKLPETTVVGTNTFGVMQFIQPGYSVLPNTRLPFRVALGTSDVYGDNRSADGYGLDVDVLIDGDHAWSKAAILQLVQLLTARSPPSAKPPASSGHP